MKRNIQENLFVGNQDVGWENWFAAFGINEPLKHDLWIYKLFDFFNIFL